MTRDGFPPPTFSHFSLRARFPAGTMPEWESGTSTSAVLWQSMKGSAADLASAMFADQSLSVYDAMKRALQPDGSCSQGQYSSAETALFTHRNQMKWKLSAAQSSPILWLEDMNKCCISSVSAAQAEISNRSQFTRWFLM